MGMWKDDFGIILQVEYGFRFPRSKMGVFRSFFGGFGVLLIGDSNLLLSPRLLDG